MFDYAYAMTQALKSVFTDKTWTFVSWVHVSAAAKLLPPGSRVISIGGGFDLSLDRLLALHYPWLSVTATDLDPHELPPAFCPPNLTVRKLDICTGSAEDHYDLVYSVQCFEHIEDDQLAIGKAISYVREGGRFLVIVPFATPEEQADAATVAEDRARNQHCRPGYDPARLRSLVAPGRFADVRVEACFWWYSSHLRNYKELVAGRLGEQAWPHLEALARLDVRPGQLPLKRTEAVGIRLLATGKSLG